MYARTSRLQDLSLTWSKNSYAFNLAMINGETALANRRVFAMADTGAPDGIKSDMSGNVYSGCGDGINPWSPGGVLLGKILIEGGIANFGFSRGGKMYLMGENELWAGAMGEGLHFEDVKSDRYFLPRRSMLHSTGSQVSKNWMKLG
jgi:gluconolactonase